MSCEPTRPPVSTPDLVVLHQRSRRLELRWADGCRLMLGHARLRCACRCAWCEGHRRRAPDEVVAGDPDVQITSITPVGTVGLQLHFSDGHDRGVYPWSYLQSLGS